MFTYQTRIHLETDEDAIVLAVAQLLSGVERKLFAAIAAGKKASDLKSSYIATFALTENNYASQEEWKADWEEQRNNSFFLVGSKDETAGNQLCVALIQDDGNLTLRLRLPDAIAKEHGKYLTIPNVHFKYGHAVLVANIRNCQERGVLCRLKDQNYKNYGEAISFRFQRDEKGWLVFASTSLTEPKCITHKALGAIGIDINADHIAVTETDRFGNPICHKTIPVVCYGKTSNQSKALIGDAVAEIIDWAQASQKPIILEKLDFQKKKTTLKESGYPKHARMLSSFSYKAIINSVHSRAFRFGVRVEEVNPAFTSLIGRVKFAEKYGLSIHESAALCIARRGLGVSERLPRHVKKVSDGKGHYVAFSLPVRNREKHVWRQWGQVQRKLKVVLAAHFRAKRSSSRSRPACCDR